MHCICFYDQCHTFFYLVQLYFPIKLQDDEVANVWLNNEAVRNSIHARPAGEIG